jgi:general secretion pathway protein C
MLTNLLKRHHLWVFILLSGLSGLALGHLGATSISILATPVFTPIQLPQSAVKETSAKAALTDYQTILNRDIFNSAGGSQNLKKIEPVKTEQPIKTKTASKWVLIGTVSGGKTPLATLSADRETATYKLNETLPDEGILAVIERNRIELRYPGGKTVVLENLAEAAQPPVQTRNNKPKKTPTVPASRATGLQVEDLGENRWQIPTEVAENARSNIGNLLTQAQAVPYLENEETTGFLIRMIQPGSLIAQLGLREGDILREVNGVSLNSPEKALQVFGQLRQARQISIGLERGGKTMTFAYEIR